MHCSGLPVGEARAWSASSSKHIDREFDAQWEREGQVSRLAVVGGKA